MNKELETKSELKIRVLTLVSQIPVKKVANFGLIAAFAQTQARVVGYILSGLNEGEMNSVPWFRVVAKDGYISSLKLGIKGEIQKQILLQEGFEIKDDKVNMEKHCIDGF